MTWLTNPSSWFHGETAAELAATFFVGGLLMAVASLCMGQVDGMVSAGALLVSSMIAGWVAQRDLPPGA